MIRHSPCEKYIQYLLVHPEQYKDEVIISRLRELQLDFIGPKYFIKLREGLRPPTPFKPFDEFHLPSKRFITAHKLYYLFFPDAAMEQALCMLKEPRAKEIVEAMLISHDPPGLIARRLSKLWRACTVEAVNRYKFFFYDTDLVDSTEIQALLMFRTDFVDSQSDEYDDQMRSALKLAAGTDPRRIAARQALPDLTGVMTGMRYGYMPNQLDLNRVLTSTQAAAINRVHILALSGFGKNSAEEARDWSMVGKMMSELKSELGSPDASLQRELQTLALATDNSQVPYIAQLSGGNHTVDLQPIEVTAEGIVSDDE